MRTSRSAFAITFLSCVENTNVVWNDRLISFISSRIPAPVLLSRFAVGSSARMIFGLRRQRARDRDALPLPAAQLRRPVVRELAELDDVEEPGDALAALLAARAP